MVRASRGPVDVEVNLEIDVVPRTKLIERLFRGMNFHPVRGYEQRPESVKPVAIK